MNDNNIGQEEFKAQNQPTQIFNIDGLVQSINQQIYFSTLQPSDQESLAVQSAAGVPNLQAPANFVEQMKIQMNEISVQMLKSWSKQIEEQAELIKKLINSPAYLARQEEMRKIATGEAREIDAIQSGSDLDIQKKSNIVALTIDRYALLQALGMIISAAIQLRELQARGVEGAAGISNAPGALGLQDAQAVQDSAGNVVGVREVNSKQAENASGASEALAGSSYAEEVESAAGGKGTSQFLAQVLLLIASEIPLIQTAAPAAAFAGVSGMHAEAIIFKEAWDALNQNSAEVATLVGGWVSALWGIGLLYQTSAEKIQNYGLDKHGNPQVKDIDFAKTYAEKMLAMVKDPQFVQSLQMTIAKFVDASNGPEAGKELMNRAKLILLSMALALLVKVEVGSRKDEGWINEMDFAGLLNGQTDVSLNDIYQTASLKRALSAEISTLISSLDPRERDAVVYQLLSYMSKNPSVESLLDQQVAFNKLLHPKSFENGVLEQRPID